MYLEYLMMLADLQDEIDFDFWIDPDDYEAIMFHIERLKQYLRIWS